jgi:hypothetical protein
MKAIGGVGQTLNNARWSTFLMLFGEAFWIANRMNRMAKKSRTGSVGLLKQ